MANVRIVIDSTADIPREIRESLGIEMVPLKVHFGTETYLDSVTIEADQFYEKLTRTPVLPTTSQPSPVEFLETYKRIAAEQPDTQIISIHLASVLSGTYQSAVLAKSMLEDEVNVTVVDSKSASYGIGLMAIAAAKAAAQGKSREQCLEAIEEIHEQCGLYFLVDTLEYLQKGGRIGRAAAFVGSLLNIKPILSLDAEGTVMSVDKVRGHKKATLRIVELLNEHSRFSGKPVRIIIAHSSSMENAQQFSSVISEHFDVKELTYTTLGPVIGTHVGPGTVAVFMLPA
ncbi:DegV family protein [Paenibacillus contaminans]|uniref:DegV family protein n=1 Tax=Paenibacillus contaminans TaxID=450362 RepID=A0A329MJ14_9BACL|nr:DegV family protein [Paenibacillus contaminans]RAV19961.1 DegV family protein [Paenibacillus contaminans]